MCLTFTCAEFSHLKKEGKTKVEHPQSSCPSLSVTPNFKEFQEKKEEDKYKQNY